MPFVPDWAPNSHPLFVHFPIALLFAAVLVDLLALAWRSRPWLHPAAVTLYVLGTLGAVAAYLSGQDAADSVMLPAEAQPVLTEHANLAWWTMWFFVIYTIARLVIVRWEGARRPVVHGVLFLIGLAGLYLPWETGGHGGEMVFRHGVGVQVAQEEETRRDTSAAAEEGPALQISESGSWYWNAGRSGQLQQERFEWLTGTPDDLETETTERPDDGPALALQLDGEPVLFTAGPSLSSIQVDAEVNLEGLDGTFMLVHHVLDAQNYDFLAIEGNTLRLGRVRDDEQTVHDEGSFAPEGWLSLRLVSDQDHYRGYVNGEMVAHGHGPAPEAGTVGVRLDGSGTARIDHLDVQVLR